MKTKIHLTTKALIALMTVTAGIGLWRIPEHSAAFSAPVYAQELNPGDKLQSGKRKAKKQITETGGPETEKPPEKPQLPDQRPVLSPQTLRMMEMIEKKNRELKRREEELRIREQTLKTLEEKVLADLEKVNAAIAKSREQLGMRQEIIGGNIESLVKVYSAMKPRDAATLLAVLDETIAVEIISRMKHKTAGQVMSKMNPQVAKNISEKIAGVEAVQLLKDKRRKETAPAK